MLPRRPEKIIRNIRINIFVNHFKTASDPEAAAGGQAGGDLKQGIDKPNVPNFGSFFVYLPFRRNLNP